MGRFEAEVRPPGGSVAVIRLQGVLDMQADEPLREAYARAIRPDTTAVLLDATAVTYINSTGIALIVGLLAEAQKGQIAVLVSGLSDHYRHIFEITRLADFMQFFPDEQAAIVGLTAAP